MNIKQLLGTAAAMSFVAAGAIAQTAPATDAAAAPAATAPAADAAGTAGTVAVPGGQVVV